MTLPSVHLPTVRDVVADLRPKRGALEARSFSTRAISLPPSPKRSAAQAAARMPRAAVSLPSSRALVAPRLSAPLSRALRSPSKSTVLRRGVIRHPRFSSLPTPARNPAFSQASSLPSSFSVHDAGPSKAHSDSPRADGLSHCKDRPSASRRSLGSGGSSRFIPWCR